ncbi:hypothetical protein SKAU_G00195930 [Synaphobranchus kaupii]|uniref:Uncharacterized protein n=1 Tax=Synaphobranchus kaupii TaxID=118154 RepID=A0A9Q1IWT9_SYNKA|nr:hypothetical protein SKAU_G00195930 [Synaphobranchus kaupii]
MNDLHLLVLLQQWEEFSKQAATQPETWVQQSVQSIVDPLQFAYHLNRGVNDALLTLLHLVKSHLDT